MIQQNIKNALNSNKFLSGLVWEGCKTLSRKTLKVSLDNASARFHTPFGISSSVIKKNVEQENEVLTKVIENIQKGDVFYDIGSSVGAYSCLVGSRLGVSGSVVAVEPRIFIRRILRDNLSHNGIDNQVVGVALADKRTSQAELELSEYASNYSTVTADELVIKEGYPTPNVVKIDVEGAEAKVVRGMRKTLSSPECRLLICELHLDTRDSEKEYSITHDQKQKMSNTLEYSGFDVRTLSLKSEKYLICRKK